MKTGPGSKVLDAVLAQHFPDVELAMVLMVSAEQERVEEVFQQCI